MMVSVVSVVIRVEVIYPPFGCVSGRYINTHPVDHLSQFRPYPHKVWLFAVVFHVVDER
jgi:hypothetical protein